ncbi:MAG TPA: hypothetical protein VN842_03505 [Thermoplasmata archaeon]|nr:hypothetical protein [Thermoplasmata archaeon]
MSDRDSSARPNHPCLDRRCGHSPEDHMATPELAGGGESVAWCTLCLRHEVRRPSWASPLRLVLRPNARRRMTRPA